MAWEDSDDFIEWELAIIKIILNDKNCCSFDSLMKEIPAYFPFVKKDEYELNKILNKLCEFDIIQFQIMLDDFTEKYSVVNPEEYDYLQDYSPHYKKRLELGRIIRKSMGENSSIIPIRPLKETSDLKAHNICRQKWRKDLCNDLKYD
ncbi:MAG TPA: hypothetical protein VN316_02150 [candidate division Zixibacteria bacterium]|nr:hypothetical protein [candidate division Zixibacteria bacterium]